MAVLNTSFTIRLNRQAKWKLDIETSSSAPKLIRCLAHTSILSNTLEALLLYHPNLVNLGEVYCWETIPGTSPSMNTDIQHPANLVRARSVFLRQTDCGVCLVYHRGSAPIEQSLYAPQKSPIQVHVRSDEANNASLRQMTGKYKDFMNGKGESDDGESDDGESDVGESDDGESDVGESDDGESDVGESDDGESDDGEIGDGEIDDGGSDVGESDDEDSLVAEADKPAATSRRIQLREQPSITIKDRLGNS